MLDFYIFERIEKIRDYIQKCEERAIIAMQGNGWMDSYLFINWIDHFILAMEKKKVMFTIKSHPLILSGHSSHFYLQCVLQG